MSEKSEHPNICEDVFQTFSNLNKPDQTIRKEAIKELLLKVTTAQKFHNEQHSNKSQSPVLRFCLDRLFTGLLLDQWIARESYSVALTLLLEAVPSMSLAEFLRLLNIHLKLRIDVSSKDRLDLCVARVLGYCVCLQLGLHRQGSVEELSIIVKELYEMSKVDGLGEICAVNITDIAIDCSDEIFSCLLQQSEILQSIFSTPVHEATPEDLFICLRLWSRVPEEILKQSILLPSVPKPSKKDWFHHIDKSSLELSDGIFSNKQFNKLLPVLEKTSSVHPRVHLVWEILLPLLLCDAEKFSFQKPHLKLKVFWKTVINHLATGDAKQRHLSHCLSVRIMQRMNAGDLPCILRGAYWEDIIGAFHSEQHLMHDSAKICLQEIMQLVKQAPKEKRSCFLPMMICRVPVNERCKEIRKELMERMQPELMERYVDDLVHCLLKSQQTGRKPILTIPEISEFEVQEILRDLKTAVRLHLLSEKSVGRLLKLFVVLSLVRIDPGLKTSITDEILVLIKHSNYEQTESFRKDCSNCLLSFCLSTAHSWSLNPNQIHSLASALKLTQSPGISLIHGDQAEIKTIQEVESLLETQIKKCKGNEAGKKQTGTLYVLFVVLKLYYLSAPDSTDPLIFQDLQRLMTQEKDGFMLFFTEVLLSLITRPTDPLPSRLLVRVLRSVFLTYSSQIDFSSWTLLLESLSNSDQFELELDEEEEMEIEQEEESSLDDQQLMVEEEEDLDQMDSFLEGVELNPKLDQYTQQEDEQDRVNEDLSSAISKILWFVKTIFNKHPQKPCLVMTPIHLFKALKSQDKELQEKFTNVLMASLKCKPKLEKQHLELKKEEILEFITELPASPEWRQMVSKIVFFLISRLMTCTVHEQVQTQLSLEIVKILIGQQFRKHGPSIVPKTLHSIFSQYKSLGLGVLTYLVNYGLELKNPYQRLKLLELVHTCLQNKDLEEMKKQLLSSRIGSLVEESIFLLPAMINRVHMDLLRATFVITRQIVKIMEGQTETLLPKEKIAKSVASKLETNKNPKLQKSLIKLSNLLKK